MELRCYSCDEQFKESNEWQIFCSEDCNLSWRRHTTDCFYCAGPAVARDHILPVAVRVGKREYKGQELVPACKLCNSVLGSSLFLQVEDRIAHLINFYVNRGQLKKKLPAWTEDELQELGLELRLTVESFLRERQEYENKVKHLRELLIRFGERVL